jgi:hypothetical protein
MSDEKLNWRKVWNVGNHSEETQGHELRRALVDAEVFPPSEVDPKWPGPEYLAKIRATLPEIINELDATDLLALYRVARLLAIIERDPEVFRYSERQSAVILARAGIDPRPHVDTDSLGVTKRVDRLLEMSRRRT